jgi:hypothetical protein
VSRGGEETTALDARLLEHLPDREALVARDPADLLELRRDRDRPAP